MNIVKHLLDSIPSCSQRAICDVQYMLLEFCLPSHITSEHPIPKNLGMLEQEFQTKLLDPYLQDTKLVCSQSSKKGILHYLILLIIHWACWLKLHASIPQERSSWKPTPSYLPKEQIDPHMHFGPLNPPNIQMSSELPLIQAIEVGGYHSQNTGRSPYLDIWITIYKDSHKEDALTQLITKSTCNYYCIPSTTI